MRLSSYRPPPLDAALLAGGLVEAALIQTVRQPAVHALGTVVIMGALAWRRRFPLAVLAVVLAGVFALGDPEGQFVVFAAVVIATYTTGSSLEGRRSLLGLLLAVGPLAVALLTDGAQPADLAAVAVLYGGAWMVGRLVRERSRRAEELEERSARLERERGREAERAVNAERARIARELHDIVAHLISVIAVQTQAVRRRLHPDQGREAEDLRAVEATARQAMAEMRRLFGVLRADGERPALAPQPGLDQLGRLLDETRAAGLAVQLRVEGERLPLPPAVDLSAYRIVQEALTNTRKHVGVGSAQVLFCFGDHRLELTVSDDGARPAAANGAGCGFGLVGMRERVALYGGTLEAGPGPDGGFVVRATLPVREERAG